MQKSERSEYTYSYYNKIGPSSYYVGTTSNGTGYGTKYNKTYYYYEAKYFDYSYVSFITERFTRYNNIEGYGTQYYYITYLEDGRSIFYESFYGNSVVISYGSIDKLRYNTVNYTIYEYYQGVGMVKGFMNENYVKILNPIQYLVYASVNVLQIIVDGSYSRCLGHSPDKYYTNPRYYKKLDYYAYNYTYTRYKSYYGYRYYYSGPHNDNMYYYTTSYLCT